MKSGTTSEGKAKASRWIHQPDTATLPPVQQEAVEVPLIAPDEIAARLAGQVAVHLRAGRWGMAHATLIAGESEVRQLLRQPSNEAMSIAERLELPVCELCVGLRTHNALEEQGMVTVGDVVKAWPDCVLDVANVGHVTRTAIAKALFDWNLLSAKQIKQAVSDGIIDSDFSAGSEEE